MPRHRLLVTDSYPRRAAFGTTTSSVVCHWRSGPAEVTVTSPIPQSMRYATPHGSLGSRSGIRARSLVRSATVAQSADDLPVRQVWTAVRRIRACMLARRSGVSGGKHAKGRRSTNARLALAVAASARSGRLDLFTARQRVRQNSYSSAPEECRYHDASCESG